MFKHGASAAADVVPPAPAPAASSNLPRAPAVGGGGAITNDPAPAPMAAAVKQRICRKCLQPGHQANSKKCPRNQKLELTSDEDGAVQAGESPAK